MLRSRKMAAVAALSAASLVATATGASATITPQSGAAGALVIANSMTAQAGLVAGASFVSVPPFGTPNGISDSPVGPHFPTEGPAFGILTSGNVNLADDANTSGSSGAGNGGGNVRGNSDLDVTVFKVDLLVPTGDNCLALNFAFYSDEFPEFVGSSVNDGFVAELDSSTWTTNDSVISAPNNFAFDPAGDVVSINSSGATSMSAAQSSGTTYDGGTSLLSASTPVTGGAHALYLSIFDQGDTIYDSAVFLDALKTGVAGPGGCEPGAVASSFTVDLTPASGSASVGTPYTLTAAVQESGAPEGAGTTVLFSVAGANPASGSGSTNSSGNATFTYTGTLPGMDTVTACVDANSNNACDPSEATDTATVDWSGGGGPVGPTCDGKAATIVGTNAAETINGTAGDDVIVGLGGRDTINGLGGNDTICAGDRSGGGGNTDMTGNDTVYGGLGNDTILGGQGNDTLVGEGGNDTLKGEAHMDMLLGGAGNDTLSGGDGTDKLGGDAGNDDLSGDADTDLCSGGSGTNTISPTCET